MFGGCKHAGLVGCIHWSNVFVSLTVGRLHMGVSMYHSPSNCGTSLHYDYSCDINICVTMNHFISNQREPGGAENDGNVHDSSNLMKSAARPRGMTDL